MPTLDVQSQQRYWRRSILIPLWVQQLLIQLCAGVVFWMIIKNFWGYFPGHGGGKPARSERGVLGTFFILYIFLILVTIAEIVLYALSYLHSGLYLFFQIVKTGASMCIWTVLFLYPFVVLDSSRQPVEASIFMATICIFLQIPMLAALIHAIFVKHEERYHHFVWDEIRDSEHAEVQVTTRRASETTPLLGNRQGMTQQS